MNGPKKFIHAYSDLNLFINCTNFSKKGDSSAKGSSVEKLGVLYALSKSCNFCLYELEEVFKEVYPGYANKISLRKVDVTQNDKSTKELIKEYDVKLVPTCIFKNEDGNITRKTEGNIQPRILENYMKEQLPNG